MHNTKNYREQGGEKWVVGGELQIAGGKITPANGVQPNTITNIANDATGTQIATAVNAIITALIGAGVIKPAE